MHRLRKKNPQQSNADPHPRQWLTPVVLASLLTLALVIVGYMVFVQTARDGKSILSHIASLRQFWPFTDQNLVDQLSGLELTLLWISLAVSWLISLLALLVNRRNPAMMLLFSGISIFSLFLSLPVIYSGVVFLADLLLLFLVGLAGNLLLDVKVSARFMIFAIGIGMIAIVLDIFLPWERSQPLTGDILYLLYAALILAFAIVIALGFQRYPLRQKLIFVVMVVSIVSIVVVVLVSINSVEETIQSTANQALQTAASQAISSVEAFLSNAIITVETEAQNTIYINYLARSENERSEELLLNVDLTLFKLLSRRDYATREANIYLRFLQGISLVDINGQVLRDTEEMLIGQDLVNNAVFLQTISGPGTYISPIRHNSAGLPLLYVASQVKASDGSILGILITRYDGNLFQQIIAETNNLAGRGSYAILLEDRYSVQLANGIHPDLNFKTPLTLNAQLVKELQAQGVVSNAIGISLSSNQSQLMSGINRVKVAWQEFLQAQETAAARLEGLPETEAEQEQLLVDDELRNLQQNLSFSFPDPDSNQSYLAAYSEMRLVPWAMIYAQSRAYFLEPLQSQVQNIQLLALVVALVAAGIAYLLSQFLAAPIGALTRVANNIAKGDFSLKAPVVADDEIGQLATTVNSMADQLSQTLANLENKVEERTVDLTRRSAQMQAAAEVGSAAVNLRNIDELLPQVCHLISERFGFYHVGIFLLDQAGKFAVLRASNSEGGQLMLRRNHRLEVGQQGIVGNVTAIGQPRIALDVGEDAVFFNNPDLPETRSEVAIPLQTGGRIFGALDVQSTQAAAFTPDDIVVLRVMADLVAAAIENARLFEESQQALEMGRRAFGDISRQGWSEIVRAGIARGYRSTDSGVYTLRDPGIQLPSSDPAEAQDFMLSIPIWVRNSIVGHLKTKKPRQQGPWTNEEVETIAKVVEQLGVALESARLYRSSQTQAERERLITEVTSHMRESLDVEAVLQVAAEQIRKVLELSKVTVALEPAGSLEESVE